MRIIIETDSSSQSVHELTSPRSGTVTPNAPSTGDDSDAGPAPTLTADGPPSAGVQTYERGAPLMPSSSAESAGAAPGSSEY